MDVYNEKIAEFVSFCIENYKVEHAISGEKAMDFFERNDVLDYLITNYEILHTQSKQFILEEINLKINQNDDYTLSRKFRNH